MRALRRRDRVDSHRNDVRRSASRASRFLFLLFLGALSILLLDYLFGSSLFLRADGLVVQRKVVVAAPDQARIVALNVVPGAKVAQGQVIARVSSERVAESVANLTTTLTGHLSRIAELEVRADQLKVQVPSARQRAQDAEAVWAQTRGIADQRLLTASRAAEIRGLASSLNDQAAALQAEASSLENRLSDLKRAASEARTAIDRLRDAYGSGEIAAPVSGVVGAKLASVGEVLVAGASVLDILTGEKGVLAYMPDSYLFGVGPGQEVTVGYGYDSYPGRVAELLPVADQLPLEFQRVFQPRERGQLVRITLPQDAPIPVFAKVRIREPITYDRLMHEIGRAGVGLSAQAAIVRRTIEAWIAIAARTIENQAAELARRVSAVTAWVRAEASLLTDLASDRPAAETDRGRAADAPAS